MAKAETEAGQNLPTLVIRPTSGWVPIDLRELWSFRELVSHLALRTITVRYKQTLLGIAWAVLNPFLSMIVFSIFFGKFAHLPSDGVPYPIFSYAALLPWNLFASGLSDGSKSLVNSRAMVTKVYFPRLALPIAAVLSGIVDFAIAFVMLFGIMIYYNRLQGYAFHLSWAWLTLPFFLLLALATALGMALWLSALNVRYRDVNYIAPFIVNFLLFLTPVVYSATMVPTQWQWLYSLNPMAAVVTGYRWALLGTANPPDMSLAVSILSTVFLLVSGLYFFRRMERSFADTI
jgi:homopolymeric O-antigen transport system permease protein